jgi:poly-gamma-glutamate synthesis protein (capsule biosynthesis protein)
VSGLLALAASLLLLGGDGTAASTGAASAGSPAFDGTIRRIDAETRERMSGVSWHRGCPVGFADLRLLSVEHWGFDGEVRRGRLVVHREEARPMLGVMRRLYRLRFPIRRMRLVDAYGADDRRSMAADNTSAFNCRFVAGTTRWSEHAYGRAIDVNPVENPYVTASGYVSPPAGAPFARRSRRAEGLIHGDGPVVRAFAEAGWEWGGDWAWPKDYQHFSATGR